MNFKSAQIFVLTRGKKVKKKIIKKKKRKREKIEKPTTDRQTDRPSSMVLDLQSPKPFWE